MTRETKRDRDLNRETERYRKAAIAALEQLEWCIGYLHQTRKPKLARALARNRKEILKRAGFISCRRYRSVRCAV
jgi:hypothetical protein